MWLAYSLLCKAILPTVIVENFSADSSSSSYESVYETTMTKKGKVSVTFSYNSTSTGSNNGGSVAIYIGGTSVFTENNTSSSPANLKLVEYTSDTEYPAGTTIAIKCQRGYTTVTMHVVGLSIITNPTDETEKFQAIIYPKEVKAIGELGVGTIYGIHDGEFKGGIIKGKSYSVETGAITLGNAVGFLEVNYNGNIIKIPYYN